MNKYKAEFADMFSKMQITNPSGVGSAVGIILPNIARYQNVAVEFGMPWQVIGCLHYRESNCDFTTHLANGDPLTADTVDVPKNLMAPLDPPYPWEEAAIAALKHEFTNWGIDPRTFVWDTGGSLYFCQCYNGFGYEQMGVVSPYLWSGSAYYTKGKYSNDSVYDPEEIDQQIGCAPILGYLGGFTQ